ncbi:MAG: 6-phospho-3-hexuloisomerase [Cereibacter sphaeroides]|uniref:6-phospho-3-hexuloisomerase n=1 Tax=Cereibacter sphaeroides TaxID=1063 RepID=A0A2W5SA24_CERSP|nr:MAG: 6-phospho-3-hexuloisomerase [Cereibacter sphaeroides]
MDFAARAERAAQELGQAVGRIDQRALTETVEEIAHAGRIAIYGVGREGLMMRALAMRLYHLGLDAHVVGEMSTPPVGPGDLLIVSSGPGGLSTVEALIGVAKAAGARVLCITAQPKGPAPMASDRILVIPAQTMADDQTPAPASILPMGSLFEGAQFLAFELIVLALRDRIGADPAAMRARHTNLE